MNPTRRPPTMYASAHALNAPDGRRLVCCCDLPDGPIQPGGQVALVPGAGMSAHTLVYMSFLLASNGFSVVRIDGRDNVGLGEGMVEDWRISTVEQDLRLVLEEHPSSRVVALGTAFWPTVRCLAETPGHSAVLVSPELDAREDGATGQDLHELVERVSVPVTMVVGEHDPASQANSMSRVRDFVGGQATVISVPGALAAFSRHAGMTQQLVAAVVAALASTQTDAVAGFDVLSFDDCIRAMSEALPRRNEIVFDYRA